MKNNKVKTRDHKIVEIQRVYNYESEKIGWGFYDGYCIITNKAEYYFLMDSRQNCCESFGYIVSEDNLEDFTDATILGIEVVDTTNEVKTIKQLKSECINLDEAVFLNVTTSNGLLQFTVYNAHNGYYGHSVYLLMNKDRILFEGSI